jgi:hypothetical protein
MPTIEQKIKQKLVDGGISPDEADEVMNRVKTDVTNKQMKQMEGRWKDDIESYPSQLLGGLLVIAKRHALEYIDEKMPKAWFRGMFEPEEMTE